MIYIFTLLMLLSEFKSLTFQPFYDYPKNSIFRFRKFQKPIHEELDGAITGTLMFKEVNLRENGLNSQNSGWNVKGCFCPGNQYYCDCTSNPNTFRLVVKKKSTKKKHRKRNPSSKECYCNSKGCFGKSCENLSGCICDISGTCWGNKCPSTLFSPTSTPLSAQTSLPPSFKKIKNNKNKKDDINQESLKQPILKSEFSSFINSEQLEESQTINPFNSHLKAKLEQCNCNQNGCFGYGCNKMKGCACIGSKCWGDQCQYDNFGNQFAKANQEYELQKLAEQGISIIKGYPVETITGYPIETIKSSQMSSIIPPQINQIDTQSLAPLDQEALLSVLEKSLPKMPFSSSTGEPIKTIIGSPIDSLIGMEIDKLSSQFVQNLPSHQTHQTISQVQAVPIEKINQGFHILNDDNIKLSNSDLNEKKE